MGSKKEGLVELVLEDENSIYLYSSVNLVLDKRKKSLSMDYPDYFDFPGSCFSFSLESQPNPQLCLNYTTPKGTLLNILLGEIPAHLLKNVGAFIHKANQLYSKQRGDEYG